MMLAKSARVASQWHPHATLTASTRRTLGLLCFALVLGVWSLIAGLRIFPAGILPAPWDMIEALGQLAWVDSPVATSPLAVAAFYSSLRVFLATVFVVLIGVPIGVLMGSFPRVNAFLSPLVDPFRSAPIVALLPILIMWFGIGEFMKISFLWLGAVVYLAPMVRDSTRSVSQSHIEMTQDLGASNFECVWHTLLPLSKPRIADSIIVCVGIEWTYITVAEYINAQNGLGVLIQDSRRLGAMDRVFAGIFVIMMLALLSDRVLRAVKRRLYPWEAK